MLNVVLFEPEIAPNTGNIIRLCANIGANLHIIEPMGFTLDDKKMRRAGLDYHEFINLKTYKNFNEFTEYNQNIRLFAITTKGNHTHSSITYNANDYFIFGPETRGLPENIRNLATNCIRIPMLKNSRSLNLSNSVAIVVYEAWKQLDFDGNI